MSLPQVKQGLKFNGLTDYVALPASPNIPASSAAVTLETWCYPEALPSGHMMTISPADTQYISILNGLPFTSIRVNGVQQTVSYNTPVTVNQLYHIVATYDGTLIRLYVNGVLRNTSGTLSGSVTLLGASGFIGKYYFGGLFFQGKLGAQRMYNRALTADEVIANYNGHVTRNGLVGEWLLNEGTGTVATDTSGNGNNGTINGATWIIKKAPVKPKKNYLPPFSQWTLFGSSSVDSQNPYKLNFTATGNFQDCYVYVPVTENTAYQLSLGSYSFVPWYVSHYNSSGALISEGSAAGTSQFITPSGCVKTRVVISSLGNGAGNFTFTNPQLERGSIATVFEPYIPVPDSKPMPQKPKKNMLPPFTDSAWSINVNAAITSPTSLVLNATANRQDTYIDVPCLQLTQYAFSIQGTGLTRIDCMNTAKDTVLSLILGFSVTTGIVFTTVANTAYIRIYFSNNTTTTGTFTFDKPQLELGSVATSFENYKLISDVKLVPLVPKKNLLPSFDSGQWTFVSNFTKSSPYSATLNLITNGYTGNRSSITIPALPNKSYTLSDDPSSTARLSMDFLDSSQTFISGSGGSNPSTGTYVSPSNTAYIKVWIDKDVTGSYSINNPQLELGAVATPFESYKLVPDVKHI